MTPCSVDSCGHSASKLGLCNAHYLRQRRYGRLELLPGQPRRGTAPEPFPKAEKRPRNELVAWAAGFVDGEGCLIIRRNGKRRSGHHLRLMVAQTNPLPLRILQSLFGGTITEKSGICYGPTHKTKFIWSAAARQAFEAVSEMLPHLTVKKTEAKIAIEFQSKIGRAISGSVSDQEIARRERLMAMLQAEKRVDYGRRRLKTKQP